MVKMEKYYKMGRYCYYNSSLFYFTDNSFFDQCIQIALRVLFHSNRGRKEGKGKEWLSLGKCFKGFLMRCCQELKIEIPNTERWLMKGQEKNE